MAELGRRAHKTLVPGVIEGQSSLLCACLTCVTTFCSVVREGSTQYYVINRIKPVWTGFVVKYEIDYMMNIQVTSTFWLLRIMLL